MTDLDPDLQALLTDLVRAHDVPGAAVEVADRGDRRRAVAGVEALGTGAPVTTRSRFAIGSISKIPTIAVALSLLTDRGYDLDTPLSELLPELVLAEPGLAEQITLWHLLTHSSGLDSDHFPDLPAGPDLLARYVESCAQIGALYRPGERFSYCNSGFILLGRIAEKLGGRQWPVLLAEEVLQPLRMDDTRLARAGGGHPEPVHGHTVDPRTGQLGEEPFWLPETVGPAGLVCTTTADLITFLRSVSPGANGLFAPVADLMATPGVATPPGHALLGTVRWCPGWAQWNLAGVRVLGYDGAIGSQCASVRVVPEHDFAAVVVTNALEGEWVARDVLDHVVKERFGVGVPQLPAQVDVAATTLPEQATFTRLGARTTLQHREGKPVLSLRFGGHIAAWTAQEFDQAPLVPAEHGLWIVRLDRGDREVAFDGPVVDGMPSWLYFDVQAHKLTPPGR